MVVRSCRKIATASFSATSCALIFAFNFALTFQVPANGVELWPFALMLLHETGTVMSFHAEVELVGEKVCGGRESESAPFALAGLPASWLVRAIFLCFVLLCGMTSVLDDGAADFCCV